MIDAAAIIDRKPATPLPGGPPSFPYLRILFWRHLDGMQRVKTLRDIGVICAADVKPLPQTVELILLNQIEAMPDGRERLWRLVKPFVVASR